MLDLDLGHEEYIPDERTTKIRKIIGVVLVCAIVGLAGLVGKTGFSTKTTVPKLKSYSLVETLKDKEGNFTSYTCDSKGQTNDRLIYVDLDNDGKTAEMLHHEKGEKFYLKKAVILASPELTRYEGTPFGFDRLMTLEEKVRIDKEYSDLVKGVKTKEGYQAGYIEKRDW